ncbi:MAG TPA: YfhO family protein [Flavitalea sp.]|nr:YfhO family protein [Flavitalea sp.]
MNKTLLQRLTPHFLAIGIFLIVSALFCLPVFKGMMVSTSDLLGWKGIAQQSFDFKEKYGHFPLWTNSVFSGMPAYQIAMQPVYNLSLIYLHQLFTLFLPEPASLFFLACLGFYFLAVVLRINNWVAIFGSLAYAFASYSAVIVNAGHTTKFSSMGYMPAVLAALILITHRRYIIGFATLMLFSTLLLFQNHLQIAYYTFLLSLLLAIAFTIHAVRTKQLRHLAVSAAIVVAAAGIAVGSYSAMLLPTYDYAPETIRGGRSELKADSASTAAKSKGGLDKEYAFTYSYGIDESFTTILPAYKGGSSGPGELPEDGKAVEALQEAQLPQEAANYFYRFLSAYWGEQPSGTQGTVYFGAIVCVLFIAGLFLNRGWLFGWIVAATIIGFILAWGNNFKAINYFLFDVLPFYNKFRAPSMALVIPQLTFSLLASLALQQILFEQWEQKALLKNLKYAGIATALVALLLVFNYFSADFRSTKDSRVKEMISGTVVQMSGGNAQAKAQGDQLATSLQAGVVSDRKALYSSDLLRTLVFMVLTSALIYLAWRKKFNPVYIAIAFVILNLVDLLPVDRRYLSDTNYVMKEDLLTPVSATAADLQIKQDTGYFRVFDPTGSDGPFNDSRPSFYHNSVGGYHPAKLGLYQDLIERQLSKNNMQVYNMLNTKYFIVSNPNTNQSAAQLNPGALGPAWLVHAIHYVNTADEEMAALDHFNPRDTVIIEKKEQTKITFVPEADSSASIRLDQNVNDYIKYSFRSARNQFAVFSEIYYPRGWKAFIDGKETPIVKVNYALRGLAVPGGTHTIEFRFEPASYRLGNTISMIMGVLSYLLLIGALIWEYRNYRKRSVQTTVKA